jgi:guanosine-3',5'-bis(diphosphate) 3'-pyrophosphohydrolase
MADPCIAVLKAAETAARWHADQKSKGAEGAPYVNHLLEVASLVADATAARDSNLIIAALMHDAIEDQDIQREEIAKRFGEDVASLVQESLPSKERKRLQVEHAPRKSRRAKILKLADKISNIRSIAIDPPDWSARRRLAYVQWGRDVVAGLRGASRQLERLFDEAAQEAEQAITEKSPTHSAAGKKIVMKKTKHEKEHPPKWNPGNSERGKVVGTAKHSKGHSAHRNPSKTPKKEHVGRRLKTSSQ